MNYSGDGESVVTEPKTNRHRSAVRRQGHADDRAAPGHRARARGVRAIIPTSRSSIAAAPAIDDHISISTVYRTVKLFEDAGIIERHDFRDGRARYEQMRESITTI